MPDDDRELIIPLPPAPVDPPSPSGPTDAEIRATARRFASLTPTGQRQIASELGLPNPTDLGTLLLQIREADKVGALVDLLCPPPAPPKSDERPPIHNKFVEPWDCAACNPEGWSRSEWTADYRRRNAAPAPAGDVQPEPERLAALVRSIVRLEMLTGEPAYKVRAARTAVVEAARAYVTAPPAPSTAVPAECGYDFGDDTTCREPSPCSMHPAAPAVPAEPDNEAECPSCAGERTHPMTDAMPCPECNGTGRAAPADPEPEA